jgi:beta-phosphoglucomutase-like phosphatase (HAD superfamily)
MTLTSTSASVEDGNWYAMTTGTFVGTLADSRDEVVVMRVVEDTPPDIQGVWSRHFEVWTVPNGHVREMLAKLKPAGEHKLLTELLKGNVLT